MDAAGEDMLDKPLETGDIEGVAVNQRRRQRRNDAVEARGSVTHGGRREGKEGKVEVNGQSMPAGVGRRASR